MGIHRRILRLAAAALLAVPGFAHAQSRQISGTVTRSGGGAPVGEATVSITGTTNSARTDAQGKFTISAPLVDVRLTVRAIGAQQMAEHQAGRPGTHNRNFGLHTRTTRWSITPKGALPPCETASIRTLSPNAMNGVRGVPSAIISIARRSEMQLDPTSL